jgi:predicted Zn-ribbon and HTH transcriptional regulator
MAVVKIHYSRQRPVVKAHLRYITHRRGEEGKTITRTLFTEEGILTKQEAYALIDSAKPGTVFYKVILSPDPKREDTRRDLDLWQLTRQTARSLSTTLNKKIRFIAVEHNDHTPNRHVHAIFLIPGRLSRQEFYALAKTARFSATREALFQRKARDLLLQNPRVQAIRSSLRARIRSAGTGGRVLRVQAGCRSCGYGELTGIPVFYTYCPTCHKRLETSPRLTLERGIEL